MSIGGNTPPYPLRCGELGCFYGSTAYLHVIKDVIRDKYKNTTQYSVDGVTGAPIPLWYHEDECGEPLDPPYADQLGTVLSATMPGYQNTGNTFAHDGSAIIQTACQKLYGFKNVQSQKVWHGCYDFAHYASGKDIATETSYSDTKYLTATNEINYQTTFFDAVNQDPALVISQSLVFSSSIDSTSGLISYSQGTATSNGPGTPFNLETSEGNVTVKIPYPDGGGTAAEFTCAIDATEIAAQLAAIYPDSGSSTPSWPSAQGAKLTINEITVTGTKIVIDFEQITVGITGYAEIIYYASIELSGEYTVADVYGHATGLAGEIDMDDDIAYPYRNDGNSFIAPLVIYNEVRSPVSPLGYRSSGWTDPNATTLNGVTGLNHSSDIIGALLPAGYGQGSPRGVFRITHQNYYRSLCETPPSVTPAIGTRTIGKWTPDYLPSNCSLWTQDERFINEITPNRMWPVQFAIAENDGVYLQKWKETLIIPPNGSYNAARPYGADRFTIDESQVYCYADGVLGDQQEEPTPVPNLTLTGLWGGQCVGGFYNGASTDASGNVTLGTKIFDVPTGWSVASGDTSTVFAKLRWEDSSKKIPGFGGKLDVVCAYDSGSNETTFTYAASPYIANGDKISIMGHGDSVLASNVSITRISDASCKVSGNYATAFWIVPYKLFDTVTNGTKYYFANDTSKGTFVARTWLLETDGWTTLSSTVAQSCIPFDVCRPQTLCASPNGESATADYAMDWPTTIDPNTVWIGEFMQWMGDPFAQTPHDPCGGGALPSSSACSSVYVEARIAVANNYGHAQNETAPTPPSPIDLGATLSPPQQAVVLGTGPIVYALNNPTKPWVIQSACYE